MTAEPREPWDDLPEPAADDETIVDTRGLERFLGMSRKALKVMILDGLPMHTAPRRGHPSRFSVPECVQWLLARHDDPMQDAKRRQIEASARKREAEAAKLEDKAVDLETVESAIKDGVAKFQSELMAVPKRCPPEVRDLVKIEISACINRLAVGLTS